MSGQLYPGQTRKVRSRLARSGSLRRIFGVRTIIVLTLVLATQPHYAAASLSRDEAREAQRVLEQVGQVYLSVDDVLKIGLELDPNTGLPFSDELRWLVFASKASRYLTARDYEGLTREAAWLATQKALCTYYPIACPFFVLGKMYSELGLLLVNLPRVADDAFLKAQVEEYLRLRREGRSPEQTRALAAADGYLGDYFLLERRLGLGVRRQERSAENLSRRGITPEDVFELAESIYRAEVQKAQLLREPKTVELVTRIKQALRPPSVRGQPQPRPARDPRSAESLASALVLDVSGSMSEPSWIAPKERKIDAAIKAVLSYVEKLDPADYASLTTFSAHAQTAVRLLPQQESAKKIFEIAPRLSPQTSTNMADGLRLGYVELSGQRESVRKPPIVITIDGFSPWAQAGLYEDWAGYLGRAIENSSQIKRIQAEIIPFSWSGDTKDTDQAVAVLKTTYIPALMARAKRDGRSFVIVAHSWGGVLAYRALDELEQDSRLAPGEVALFLTLGTPLNAQNAAFRAFAQAHLGSASSSLRIPSVVNQWSNYWTERDNISGPIPVADNTQLPNTLGLDHRSYYRDAQFLEMVGAEVAVAAVRQGRVADVGARRRVSVLLSDGKHNVGPWSNVLDVAKQFASKGWKIYTLGFGKDVDEAKLKELAGLTGGFYTPGDPEIVKGAYVDIRYDASGRSGILRHSENLDPSGELRYKVAVSPGAKSMQVDTSWLGSRLETALVSPTGRLIRGRDLLGQAGRYVHGRTYEMLEIRNPEPGTWEVQVRWADPPPRPERVIVSVSEKTDIVANILGFRSWYRPGEGVSIGVRIAEATAAQDLPLRNARVVAAIRKPSPEIVQAVEAGTGNWAMYKDVVQNNMREISLYDDGQHEDYGPNDGIYANTFTETVDSGPYIVTIEISGLGKNGENVTRRLQGSFQIGPITRNRITVSREIDWLEKLATGARDIRPELETLQKQPAEQIEELLKKPGKTIEDLLSQ